MGEFDIKSIQIQTLVVNMYLKTLMMALSTLKNSFRSILCLLYPDIMNFERKSSSYFNTGVALLPWV